MYNKIVAIDSLYRTLESYRQHSKKIVFTNGCFDILHPGHIDYLAAAAQLGELLVIAVNDDASVSQLKGPTRPINNLQNRMTMLAALQSVDFVISFSESTPLALIKLVQPDILVKGGDYQKENIVGAELVEAAGGEVIVIPFLEGHSTTALIKKIKNS